MKSNSNNPVYTRDNLRLEQYRLKQEIKAQELELRQRVQRLPGEIFYVGAGAIIPGALTGNFTEKLLRLFSRFINKAMAGKGSGRVSGLLTIARQAGIFTLLKLAYNTFIGKKKNAGKN